MVWLQPERLRGVIDAMSDTDGFSRGGARRSDRHRAKHSPAQAGRVRATSADTDPRRRSAQRGRESWTTVDPGARRRRRRGRLAIVGLVVVVLLLAGGGAAYAWFANVSGQLRGTTPAFLNIKTDLSKAPAPGKPFYMVIMGTATRPTETTEARSDTLMVAYVDAARKRITTMSIPRDTRVTIPGHGVMKINAAMQIGGPQLTIETVKQLTGLPVSHWAYIDFSGFKDIVDAVGGIDINVPYRIYDIKAANNHPSAALVKKGPRHLDGAHALTFVRAREQFANQDFTRMKDQQLFMKALAKKILSMNLLSMPGLASSASRNIHTDLSIPQIVGLALNFRGMNDKMLQSVTMPGSPQTIGGVSYVVPDVAGLAALTAKMERGELFTAVPTTGTVSATGTIGH